MARVPKVPRKTISLPDISASSGFVTLVLKFRTNLKNRMG